MDATPPRGLGTVHDSCQALLQSNLSPAVFQSDDAVHNVPSVNTSDYILDFSQNFVLFGDTVDKYKNSLRHVILLKASYYRQ